MKYASLESLRGVAALAVVLFHSGFVVESRGPVLENASLFVDFFFVLSGFVMAHAYQSRIAQGFGLRDFVVLRLGRLYPLHVFCVLLWVAYVLAMMPWRDPAVTHHLHGVLPHLLMLNSVGLQPQLSLNYPAWSVGAEFWGCLIFFALAAGLRRRLTAGVAMAAGLLCYGVLIAQGEGTLQRTHDLGLLRCLGGFFLGVALHLARAHMALRPQGTGAEAMACALAVFMLAQPPGSVAIEIATIAAFAAVVWVFAGSDGRLTQVLTTRVPAFLGRVSYSIYMLHALVLLILFDLAYQSGAFERVVSEHPVHGKEYFLQTALAPLINAVAVLLVIGLAALAYRFIEDPCRRASRRWVAGAPQKDAPMPWDPASRDTIAAPLQ